VLGRAEAGEPFRGVGRLQGGPSSPPVPRLFQFFPRIKSIFHESNVFEGIVKRKMEFFLRKIRVLFMLQETLVVSVCH